MIILNVNLFQYWMHPELFLSDEDHVSFYFCFCSREKCWFVHIEVLQELRHKCSRWKFSPILPSTSRNCEKFCSHIALTDEKQVSPSSAMRKVCEISVFQLQSK